MTGLERQLERTLAGHPSFEVQRVNQFGRVVEILHTRRRRRGHPRQDDAGGRHPTGCRGGTCRGRTPSSTGRHRHRDRPDPGHRQPTARRVQPGGPRSVPTGIDIQGHHLLRPAATGLRPRHRGALSREPITVGGREFANAGDSDRGEITLAGPSQCRATPPSPRSPPRCWAVQASPMLPPTSDTAPGTTWPSTLPFPLFPEPTEDADTGAAGIGQGMCPGDTPAPGNDRRSRSQPGSGRRRRILETGDAGTPTSPSTRPPSTTSPP